MQEPSPLPLPYGAKAKIAAKYGIAKSTVLYMVTGRINSPLAKKVVNELLEISAQYEKELIARRALHEKAARLVSHKRSAS